MGMSSSEYTYGRFAAIFRLPSRRYGVVNGKAHAD